MDRRSSLRLFSLVALMAALVALALPAKVSADGDEDFVPGAIVGRVVDANGDGVAGAAVHLVFHSPRGTFVVGRTESGRAGGFEFPRVRPGHYVVKAEKRGVGSGAARAAVRSGESVRVRVQLSSR